MPDIELETVNVVQKGRFPLKKNEFLDLDSLYMVLAQEQDLKKLFYEPETKAKFLFVELDGFSLSIYRTGKLTVFSKGNNLFGQLELKKDLKSFYNSTVKNFLKKPEAIK